MEKEVENFLYTEEEIIEMLDRDWPLQAVHDEKSKLIKHFINLGWDREQTIAVIKELDAAIKELDSALHEQPKRCQCGTEEENVPF